MVYRKMKKISILIGFSIAVFFLSAFFETILGINYSNIVELIIADFIFAPVLIAARIYGKQYADKDGLLSLILPLAFVVFGIAVICVNIVAIILYVIGVG